jgi:non-ribosomal peptide synthetase component F
MSEQRGGNLAMAGTGENGEEAKETGNILTVFAERVAEGPERLAVRDAKMEWTYRELDRVANGVAQALIAELGRGEEPVALMTEHDAGHIAARLGIQKAGKFVFSVDAQEPEDRVRGLLEQAETRMMVTDGANRDAAAALAGAGMGSLDMSGLGEAETAPVSPEEIESGSPCGVL